MADELSMGNSQTHEQSNTADAIQLEAGTDVTTYQATTVADVNPVVPSTSTDELVHSPRTDQASDPTDLQPGDITDNQHHDQADSQHINPTDNQTSDPTDTHPIDPTDNQPSDPTENQTSDPTDTQPVEPDHQSSVPSDYLNTIARDTKLNAPTDVNISVTDDHRNTPTDVQSKTPTDEQLDVLINNLTSAPTDDTISPSTKYLPIATTGEHVHAPEDEQSFDSTGDLIIAIDEIAPTNDIKGDLEDNLTKATTGDQIDEISDQTEEKPNATCKQVHAPAANLSCDPTDDPSDDLTIATDEQVNVSTDAQISDQTDDQPNVPASNITSTPTVDLPSTTTDDQVSDSTDDKGTAVGQADRVVLPETDCGGPKPTCMAATNDLGTGKSTNPASSSAVVEEYSADVPTIDGSSICSKTVGSSSPNCEAIQKQPCETPNNQENFSDTQNSTCKNQEEFSAGISVPVKSGFEKPTIGTTTCTKPAIVKTSRDLKGDLKIKLEKFKELNRSWQKRKPGENLEKPEKSVSPAALGRQNIFDTLTADLGTSTSAHSMETEQPFDVKNDASLITKQPHTEESVLSESKCSDSSSNKSPKADEPSDVDTKNRTDTVSSKDSIEDHHSDAKQSDSSTDTKIAETLSSDMNTNILPVVLDTEKPEIDSEDRVHDQEDKEKSSEDSGHIVSQTSPINETVTPADDDDEQNMMKIMEIFSVQQGPKNSSSKSDDLPKPAPSIQQPKDNGGLKVVTKVMESVPKRTDSPKVIRSEKGVVRSETESLLDVIRLESCEGEQTKKASNIDKPEQQTIPPRKPSDINWPGLGVKRCLKCGFTTSDESMFQVHSCRRTSGISTVKHTVKRCLHCGFVNADESVFQRHTCRPDTTNSETGKTVDSTPEQYISPESRQKVKCPPKYPKVWWSIDCCIIKTGLDMFKCSVCNHSADFNKFIGHLVEHMMEYPYTCPYCEVPGPLVFQRCVDVTKHISTHENVALKFSMFGYASAKHFLERVTKDGKRKLNGIWVNSTCASDPPDSPKVNSNSSGNSPVTQCSTPSGNPSLGLQRSLIQTLGSQTPPVLHSHQNSIQTVGPVATGSVPNDHRPLLKNPGQTNNAVTNSFQSVALFSSSNPPLQTAVVNSVPSPIRTLPVGQPTIVQQRLQSGIGTPTTAAPVFLLLPSALANQSPTVATSSVQSLAKNIVTTNSAVSSLAPVSGGVARILTSDSFLTASPGSNTTQSNSLISSPPSIALTRIPVIPPVSSTASPIGQSAIPLTNASGSSASAKLGWTTILPPNVTVRTFPSAAAAATGRIVESASVDHGPKKPTPTSPNILRKKPEKSSVSVTVGKINHELYCIGCNYKTLQKVKFASHIWSHLHEANATCQHKQSPNPSNMFERCSLVLRIVENVPVVTAGGVEKASKAAEESTSGEINQTSSDVLKNTESDKDKDHSKDDRDGRLQIVETVCARTVEDSEATSKSSKESQSPNLIGTMTSNSPSVNESMEESNDQNTIEDDDCTVIEQEKPEPVCIDLTDDVAGVQSNSKTGVNTNEGRTVDEDIPKPEKLDLGLRIESTFSLSGETAISSKNTVDQQTATGSSQQTTVSELSSKSLPSSTTQSRSLNSEEAKRKMMFYVCGFEECPFSSIMSEQFKHHLLLYHRGAKEYPCAHCGHRSPGEEELFRHMSTHSAAKMFLLYKCGFSSCRFGTNLISEFQQHNVIFHANAAIYKCASCKSDYPTLQELTQHLQASLLKFVQCPHCSVKTKDRLTILGHIRESHPEKPRQITVTSQLVCSLQLPTPRRPSTDASQKANSTDNSARTSENKPTSKGEREKRRASSENAVTPERSSHKQKSAVNSEKSVLDAIVPTSADPRFICPSCSFTTSSVIQLKSHIHTHATSTKTDQPFLCMICSKGFDHYSKLSQHMNTHDGSHVVNCYSCRYCKVSTNQSAQITQHMEQVHADCPPFYDTSMKTIESRELKCKICRFTTRCGMEFKSHINDHEVVQIHPGSQDPESTNADDAVKYCCPVCKKSMSKYINLEKHIRLQHNEVDDIVVYRCKICPYISTSFKATLSHWNQKHPGESQILRMKRPIREGHSSGKADVGDATVDFFHCEYCAFSANDRTEYSEHVKCHEQGELDGAVDDIPKQKSPAHSKGHEASFPKGPDVSTNFSIPAESIFNFPIRCPKCEYSTKVRVNLIRHMKHHKASPEDTPETMSWKIPPWKKSPVKIVGKIVGSSGEPEHLDGSPRPNPPSVKADSPMKSPLQPSPTGTVGQKKFEIRRPTPGQALSQEYFKCQMCPYKTTQQMAIYSHLRTHGSLSQLKCSYCSFKCSNKVNMIKHLRKEHPESPRKYDGDNKAGMKRYIVSGKPKPLPEELSSKKRKAPETEAPLAKKTKLVSLLKDRQVGVGSPIKNTKVASRPNNNPDASYECVLCGFKSNTIDGLEEHFMSSHQVKAFVCSRCKFQSLKLLGMEEHLLRAHNQKQMLYKMSENDKKKPTIVAKTSPMKAESSGSKEQKTTKRRTSVSKSQSPVNASPGVKSKQHFKCSLCSSIAGSRNSLLDHTRKKHGPDVTPVMVPVTVHKCLDCGRRFRNRNDAAVHNFSCMKRIIKESKEEAEAADAARAARNSTESDNNDQLKTSPSPPVDSDEDIDKTIDDDNSHTKVLNMSGPSSDLRGKTHGRRRSAPSVQYVCKFCGHTGLARQRMREHYFVHYKYSPYKCVYCPTVAIRPDRLKVHINNVHPGQVLDSKYRKNPQIEQKIEKLLCESRKPFPTGVESPQKSPFKTAQPSISAKSPVMSAKSDSSPSKVQNVTAKVEPNSEHDPEKPFKCAKCDFVCKTKCNLEKHAMGHGPARLKCAKCDFKANFPYVIRRHFEKLHPDDESKFIKMEVTETESIHEQAGVPVSTLGTPPKRHVNPEDFVVIADDHTQDKLAAHFPLHDLYSKFQDQTKRMAYKCLICTFKAYTSGLIATHMYKHLPRCFECFYCDFRSYPSSNITVHQKRIHEGEIRKFKYFKNEAFQEFNDLRAQIGVPATEPPPTKKLKLEDDAESEDDQKGSPVMRKFKPAAGVKKLVLSDSESDFDENSQPAYGINFCCHLCKFKIRDQTRFSEHLSLHEAFMEASEDSVPLSKCGFCSFYSTSQKEFNNHVATHVSERPIKCSHCDYTCFAKAHVRAHIRKRHPGQKIAYTDKTTQDEPVQVREPTPTPSEFASTVDFEPVVVLKDILFLQADTFDDLVSSNGVVSVDLVALSNDKFLEVFKASGLCNDDIMD